jgi:hypothetical protein
MREESGLLCSCCGEPVSTDNLAWDVEMPDPLAYLSERDPHVFSCRSVTTTARRG